MTDTATAPDHAALQAAVAAFTPWQRSAALRIIALKNYRRIGTDDIYKVKSSTGSHWYLTDPSQCSCPAGSYNPHSDEPGLCKHRCAVILLVTGASSGVIAKPVTFPVPDYTGTAGWDMADWPDSEVTVSGVVAALESCGYDADQVKLVTADGELMKIAGVTTEVGSEPGPVWVVVLRATGEDVSS
jgi:hypothetical protein